MLNMADGTGLQEEVLRLARRIPRGRVSTYGALAGALGNGNLARLVGRALNKNPRPVETPCHRVVHSDGRIGGYKLGTGEKTRLLEEEGVTVKSGRVADFRKHLYEDFEKTTQP